MHKSNEGLRYERFFFLFLYYPQRILHLQIMCLILFSQRMVIQILFNNKIHLFSFAIIHIYIYIYIVYIIEGNL